MNLIEKLRRQTGNYFLKKGLKNLKRNKKLVNIYSAASVGILFELTEDSVYYAIQQHLQKLQDRKIKVKALGYVKNNKAADHFLPVLSFDFFSEKQTNWLEIPKATCVQAFIDTDFDICLNLASENIFPLKYVAGLSNSRLKVGAYSSEFGKDTYDDLASIYDVMLKGEDEHDQVSFLNYIHDYLTILNPKEND